MRNNVTVAGNKPKFQRQPFVKAGEQKPTPSCAAKRPADPEEAEASMPKRSRRESAGDDGNVELDLALSEDDSEEESRGEKSKKSERTTNIKEPPKDAAPPLPDTSVPPPPLPTQTAAKKDADKVSPKPSPARLKTRPFLVELVDLHKGQLAIRQGAVMRRREGLAKSFEREANIQHVKLQLGRYSTHSCASVASFFILMFLECFKTQCFLKIAIRTTFHEVVIFYTFFFQEVLKPSNLLTNLVIDK